MRKLFLVILLAVLSNLSYSQSKGDLGVLIGQSYYLGDINTSKQFYNSKFALGAIYRHPYRDTRYAIRGSLIMGSLAASDLDFPNLYQQQRKAEFSTSFYELAGQLEFNFFPYRHGDQKNNNSPYVAAGLSVLYAGNTPFPIQLAIPFGVGYKFNISENVSAGLEWSFRKTFTDLIDNITGFDDIPMISSTRPFRQTGYINDNDWYSVAGLFITFKFPSSYKKCDAYESYE
jgi:hypothetical protein